MAGLVLRKASATDALALETLIRRSVHGLQAGHYGEAEREAALGDAFGVDHGLIQDETYWMAEIDGAPAGCGGWSDREALYGARGLENAPSRVNPTDGAARIRAFFVAPEFARRGVARALLSTAEADARTKGFTRVVLSATLTGEPFYAAHGYIARERTVSTLAGGARLTFVLMERALP